MTGLEDDGAGGYVYSYTIGTAIDANNIAYTGATLAPVHTTTCIDALYDTEAVFTYNGGKDLWTIEGFDYENHVSGSCASVLTPQLTMEDCLAAEFAKKLWATRVVTD